MSLNLSTIMIICLNSFLFSNINYSNWKIAAIISERQALGEPSRVIYVSGEEVSAAFFIQSFANIVL